MGSRYEVELTLNSATNLKNVNWRYGPVMPYVVVWIDPKCKMSTRVDEMGDINPHWDQTIVIPFNSPVEDSTLFIDVVHANAMEGTKPLMGSAWVPLHSVVNDVGFGHRIDRMLELRRQSGRPHGKINVRLNIRQPQPQYGGMDPYPPAYGVPQPQHGSTRDFHVAPSAYGAPYGAPHHPPSSGYAATPAGYPQTTAPGGYYDGGRRGYGSQPSYGDSQPPNYEKPKKKSSSGGGLGLGAGLAMGAVAGALGAVAISEGIDYAEDKFDDHVQEKVEEELEDRYDLDD